MQIRAATADDLELVVAMRLAFLADHDGTSVEAFEPSFRAATAAYVGDTFATGRFPSWLATDDTGGDGATGDAAAGDEAVLGAVSVLLVEVPPRPNELRTREGYVLNMYVVPSARRQGVGSALLTTCLADLDATGVRRVWLHATTDGEPLYVQHGFTPMERWMELHRPS